MPKVSKINLEDNKNTWIIGTPHAVDISSPGFSPSIQIKYNKNPCKETHLKNEKYIVSVGDQVTYTLIKNNIKPVFCIVDFKTKRNNSRD